MTTFLANYVPLVPILLSSVLARLCRSRTLYLKGLGAFDPDWYLQKVGVFFFFLAGLAGPVMAERPLPGTTLWRGPTGNAVVALTFDDGPKSPFTQHLLACLRGLGVKATFFVVGASIEKEPDLLAQISAEGHEVANHSYSHSNFTRLSDDQIRYELTRTQDLIVKYTETRTPWFRPPGGNTNERVQSLLGTEGLVSVMWTVNSEDYTVLNQRFPVKNELKDIKGRYSADYSGDVARRVLEKVSPGSIVLMHNGGDATIAALPQIVAGLRERGFGFVTMSELMDSPQNRGYLSGANP